MPKNLGLYNDDLSTPRKKDVDTCYGPNNVPPYPVTSVNGKTGDVTVTAELPEHLVRYDTLAPVESTVLVNADTLQGHAASYFATATDVSKLQTDVSNLQTDAEKLQTDVSNLQTEQENINTSLSNKQETITKQSVTFSTDWTGDVSPYSQIVTVSGTTANSKVDLQPEAIVIQQMVDDGTIALYIINDNGVLTAYAVGEKPTVEMTIQVTITEVNK